MSRAVTRIDLMRHGEPLGGRKVRGQHDDPLSEAGWKQMWAAAGSERPWQALATSPLARCHAFAERLSVAAGLPLVSDARLMERSLGAWEGRTHEDIASSDPGAWEKYRNDPEHSAPPGAEPLAHFSARVTAAWDECVARGAGRHTLVVCHAGVMRAILAHVLGAPQEAVMRIDIGYAALARLRVADGRAVMLLT